MLYVFHVDTGTMVTFEMDLALESVNKLREHIEIECDILADKQVLLINGGQSLDPEKTVCSYSAGTDTNPIFLFSKSSIEATVAPSCKVDLAQEYDMELKVKEHCDMQASYQTVAKRTKLAQELLDLARDQYNICDRMVHDQHLQQQGWSAVVANLEDITAEFRQRSEVFKHTFGEFIKEREDFIEFLKHFETDLTMLEKIPLLPVLRKTILHSENEDETGATSSSAHDHEMTLFEWISNSDDKDSIEQLNEHCSLGLEKFDNLVLQKLTAECKDMLLKAENDTMKEVRGLSERLSGLETLMHSSKKTVSDQQELAKAFQMNKTRADTLKDNSIYSDLCATHHKQLLVMLENHKSLVDIRKRCFRAKEELCQNLYHRLKWVTYIESNILDLSHRLMIYNENLKRLRRHLGIMQQIHLAPSMYINAVVEVVRRRTFSQAFLLWASELACHLLTIHNEEVAKRKEFQAQFEGHFLSSMFPGLEDLPPGFATQAPQNFDCNLPQITKEEMKGLLEKLPELAEQVTLETFAIPSLLLTKSLIKIDDGKPVEDKLVQVVADVGLSSNLDRNLLSEPCLAPAQNLPHLKDVDRGCESETDTEEFEKVGQSPLELNFDQKDRKTAGVALQDMATSTSEDTLQISRSEHDKLKAFLLRLAVLAGTTITNLRQELNSLKEEYSKELLQLQQEFLQVQSARQQETKLIVELANLQQANTLQKDLLETKLRDSEATVKKLSEELLQKDKELRETIDRLNKAHKDEIDSIRARFKLMTMEQSPSDSSLDKISDSISNHESIVLQMKENFEMDKDRAIQQVLEEQQAKYKKQLQELEDKLHKQEESKEEKDKLLEVLREREHNLTLECLKHKTTIVQLTEENDSNTKDLMQQLEMLKQDKEELLKQQEVPLLQESMVVSVPFEQKDATTSPIKQAEPSQEKPESLINIGSCEPGSKVLVVWDPTHENFIILQDSSKSIYFLHPDYLTPLNLKVENGKPNVMHCIGKVIRKECCCAIKPENRYKVPYGSRFYRVKVKPFTSKDVTQSLYFPKTTSSHSQMSQSTTTVPEQLVEQAVVAEEATQDR